MGLIIFLLGKRGQNIENLRKIRISVKKKKKKKLVTACSASTNPKVTGQ